MSKSKFKAWPAVLIAGGIGCAFLGDYVRDRIEIGETPPDRLAPLLASTQKDPDVPESENFLRVVELLKDNFVDPVTDERKLAYGAVKGMIGSLADPDSIYMDAKEFDAYKDLLRGKVHGIGAELRLAFTDEQIAMLREKKRFTDIGLLVPKLVVTSVAPGSPAEKAGIRIGDRIDSVDGKWVMSAVAIKNLRDLQQLFEQKKIGPEKLTSARERLRDQAENGTMPARAKDTLSIDTTGNVQLVWEREGKSYEATVPRTTTVVSPVIEQPDGSYRVRIIEGAAAQLMALAAKGKPLVLDLRNGGQGSPAAIKPCIAAVAKAGNYGVTATDRNKSQKPFEIANGAAKQVPITLIVDGSTRGAAEIFALALNSHAGAKLRGTAMAGDKKLTETIALDDGSGYTISTGIYRPIAIPEETAR